MVEMLSKRGLGLGLGLGHWDRRRAAASPSPLVVVLLLLLLLDEASAGRSFARFQRGDQGPDMTDGHGATDGGDLLPPIGGPNVCRSSTSSFCCPGWRQRGLTGLCLVPICARGCGDDRGRCIKPNLCLCDGGKIMPRCQGVGAAGKVQGVKIMTLCDK